MSVPLSCRLIGFAVIGCTLSLQALAEQPLLRAASNTTPQQVFDGMRESFRADKAKGLHASYQFNLSGPHGGEWWMEVRDGKLTMGRGKVAKPDVTFVATDADWVALSNGTLQGWWAHLSGRLKIHGSQALARKLDQICP
jgi:putative sterol carrier protein